MTTWAEILGTERLLAMTLALLRVALICLLTWVALRALARIVEQGRAHWLRAAKASQSWRRKASGPQDHAALAEAEKRSHTIAGLLHHTLSALVLTVAFLSIAQQAGLDIRALLGAAGIVSLAVGFGARSLVQDLINGLFLLLEGQIREGDIVRLGEVSGLVEEINLRHVRLRSGDGAVHIVSNGSVRMVSNLTLQFAYFVWDLRLHHKADPDFVARVAREIAEELRADPAWAPDVLEPLEVLGVDGFHAGGAILKMRVKTAPRRQWAVGRAMNRLLKQRLEADGVPFPLPVRLVHSSTSRAVAP
jgi:small conductance mechanosensitive channel